MQSQIDRKIMEGLRDPANRYAEKLNNLVFNPNEFSPAMRSVMKRVLLLLLLVAIFTAQVVTAQETKSARYLLVVQGDLPLYPAVARTAHVSGSVQVRVTVKDGEVIGTEVTSGNPPSCFRCHRQYSRLGSSTRQPMLHSRRLSHIN